MTHRHRDWNARPRCAIGIRLLVLLWAGVATASDTASEPTRQFTFAWPYAEGSTMAPRGGTTTGAPVQLSKQPSRAWQTLREPGISKKERDRRAILAMAGPYRASFDFLETVGFSADFAPGRPYQSWGTEYVYVIVDEPDHIDLQHLMVMFFAQADGSISEPMVVKHWRQEWRYEDRDLHVFAGYKQWRHERLARRDVRGKWSQAVFQVDDSPRYEAIGAWDHSGGVSRWLSEETWRPLPRREFSVRDDYDVLVGTNRHTIVPAGWIHEEDNLKVTLDGAGVFADETPVLAREAGLNRYERIVDYDWSAGDEYWAATAAYWQQVREAWAEIYRERDVVRLKDQVGGQPLFMAMFEQADRFDGDVEVARREIDETLGGFLID